MIEMTQKHAELCALTLTELEFRFALARRYLSCFLNNLIILKHIS
jgi:hypothetical protein